MTDSLEWEEVVEAREQERHELVLSGADISSRIESSGLDVNIFSLTRLNFLEVSRTCLTEISPNIGNLINITQLSIRSNKLTSLPVEIGQLTKLKYLDASENALSSLPDGIFAKTTQLHSLNLSINSLTDFPAVNSLKELHDVCIAKNKLTSLPEGVEKLSKLLNLDASNNKVESMPNDLAHLVCLKQLNLQFNQITEVPATLALCSKLRDLNLRDNKLRDNRLRKMAEDSKTSTGSILEYLRKQRPAPGKGGKGGRGGVKTSNSQGDSESVEGKENPTTEVDKTSGKLVIRVVREDTAKIVSELTPEGLRPFIVACVVKSVNMAQSIPGKGDAVKAFIKFQDQLHRTVCDNRKKATIASHDCNMVKFPLLYTCRPGDEVKIQMLNTQRQESGKELFDRLWREAQDERKRKKRRDISGVYQYLTLIEGKTDFAVLLDSDNTAISLPPITNCNATKMTSSTTDILLEVSGVSFATCKEVCDQLVLWLADLGVSSSADGSLSVTQLRIMDNNNQLKVAYPSRTDLVQDKFEIEREN